MLTTKPIRVLVVASKYIIGGQTKQALQLMEALHTEPGLVLDHQPIDPRFPGPLQFLLDVPVLRTILKFFYYSLQLLLRVPRYDIVHMYSAGVWSYAISTLPALFVAKLYRKKFILFYVDGRVGEHLATWRTAVPTIRMVDVVVGANQHILDVFAQYGIQARLIYNGLNSSILRYRPRKNLRPRLMTNRLLEPLYNHPCILRAFARVLERYPDAELVIGNEGMCRPQLEKMASEMGLRNYEFIGVRKAEEVPLIYDAADIYLTSPNVDCMPGSILESFEAGLPVIATRAGGIPYIIRHGETGMLVDINDDAGMAECVFRLLEDPNLVERMTATARAEVKRYGWEQVRSQWILLYRELMAKGNPRTP
jgi:glycosyltransferase involved in cell wall biosynthesis